MRSPAGVRVSRSGVARVARAIGVGALLFAGAAGCGVTRPTLQARVIGRACAACGMDVRNPRFAAAWCSAGRVLPFDSIECALHDHDAASAPGSVLFLADYPSGTLHRADSLWVVRAEVASPMGGGFAAFLDRREAERIAASRGGKTLLGTELIAGSGSPR
jgi:hypothetical protein